MKPYCSVKDFPFNYSPAIQFFTTGFLISTMEVGGITGWKPATVRALSRACGCANSCVWRAEWAASHQPQDWWDLLTLMSRATAVPAQLTNSLCTLLMFSVRVQGRQEEVLWNHQLWLCNVLFACLPRALQKNCFKVEKNWSVPSSRVFKLKDREKCGH